jgi:Carbohydrate-binding module 48 (Isoamylase N-terminal domain)
MPVLNQHIDVNTPFGATPAFGGATFRTWAPNARDVYLASDAATTNWTPAASERLFPLGDGTWAGFLADAAEGDPYLFWIRGPEGGTAGFKRDPHARELGIDPWLIPLSQGDLNMVCLIRNDTRARHTPHALASYWDIIGRANLRRAPWR